MSLTASSQVAKGGTKQLSSATPYTDAQFIAYNRQENRIHKCTTDTLASATISFYDSTAKGMHYNKDLDAVFFVNGDDGTLETASFDSLTSGAVVSTVGDYKTLRGELTNTYIFGWKVDTDGTTNLLFRTDSDDTNEITVTSASLLGSDSQLDGFDADVDNQLLYFHDLTTRTLRSVSWDLVSNFTTHSLILSAYNGGSIAYAWGYIYYGGIDQANTSAINSNFYRFEISTGTIIQISGIAESVRNGDNYTPDIYIDPYNNFLIVSGESYWRRIVDTDFDFYGIFIQQEAVYGDGLGISWTAVSGATSYQIVVNGTPVGTTTGLTYDINGYGDGVVLTVVVQFSTDDLTYTDADYRTISYTVHATLGYRGSPSDNYLRSIRAHQFADPYDPSLGITYIGSSGDKLRHTTLSPISILALYTTKLPIW